MTSPTAGPSSEVVPPPSHIQPQQLTEAERAQLHLPAKRSFLRIHLSKSRSRNSATAESDNGQPLEQTATSRRNSLERPFTEQEEFPFIKVGEGVTYAEELMENYEKDVYRWAVMYENQRGATVLSTPYYSRLSLLPIDPPAFTLPTTTKITRNNQPSLDLSSYPLPDGSWRWVSREWMVDMRGDGQTQYDGFEYNWSFRTKHWRSSVGFLSAGGWVRRRRWVRLMVRPAIVRKSMGDTASDAASGLLEGISRQVETGATRPPSVMVASESDEYNSDHGDEDTIQVWTGDVEQDWGRCRRTMTRLDRDGRKLELWHRWLRDLLPREDAGEVKAMAVTMPPLTRKQWTEDSQYLPSQHVHDPSGVVDEHLVKETGVSINSAAREHLLGVLRLHCHDIVHLFIYPHSRTIFLELLARSNLLLELDVQMSRSVSSSLDFWSSSQSLRNLAALDSELPA